MTRVLTGPGRTTNAIVLAITLGSTIAMSAAVSQLPTVLTGLVSLALVGAALWSFSEPSKVFTVLGTYLTVLAAVGLGVTLLLSPVLAYEAYKDADSVLNIVVATVLSAVTPWGTVGATACALGVTTTGFRRETFSDVLESLLTAVLVIGVGVLVVVWFHVEDVAIAAVASTAVERVQALERHNAFVSLGAVAVLVAVATSLAVVVWTLPRVEGTRSVLADVVGPSEPRGVRASRRAGPKGTREPAEQGDGEADSPGESDSPAVGIGGTDGTGRIRNLLATATVTRFTGLADLSRRDAAAVAAPPGLFGAVLIGVGLALDGGATFSSLLDGPFAFVGRALDAVAGVGWLRAGLLWLVFVLATLRVTHFAMDWVVYFPWKRYRDRLVMAVVPAILVVAGVVAAPSIVETVVQTPSIHYVNVVLPDGKQPLFTMQGLEMIDAPPGETGFHRDTEDFVAAVELWIDMVGVVPIVLAPVFGVAFLGGWILVLARYVARPAVAAVSSAGVVAGWLLFGSALAGAVLEVDVWLVLVVAAGAVLVLDLQDLSRGLTEQLDPAAKTARGELVRAGGVGLVVSFGATLTFGGLQLTRTLGGVDARPDWQLLVVLVCSVLGTGLALVYLSYRRS